MLTRTDLIAAAVILALLAAIAADLVAWRAWRAALDLQRQMRARLTADRRRRDVGPPTGQPERRRHRAPDDARARRRDVDQPQWLVVDHTLTGAEAEELQRRLERELLEGQGTGRPRGLIPPDDQPVRMSDGRTVQPPEWWRQQRDEPTTELEQVDLPTVEQRATDPRHRAP